MNTNPLKELGTSLGVGIIAGVAGTAAITLSQMIEMKITNRQASDTPTKAVSKVLHVKPVKKEKKPMVIQEIHWTYGSSWGVGRGLLSYAGITGLPASVAHFGAIWGTELLMMPGLNLAPPVTEQKPKAVAIDAWHHAVYALVAGFVFDAIISWDN